MEVPVDGSPGSGRNALGRVGNVDGIWGSADGMVGQGGTPQGFAGDEVDDCAGAADGWVFGD